LPVRLELGPSSAEPQASEMQPAKNNATTPRDDG
jgi:hypothetical protein